VGVIPLRILENDNPAYVILSAANHPGLPLPRNLNTASGKHISIPKNFNQRQNFFKKIA
jgi:hypothetical protein